MKKDPRAVDGAGLLRALRQDEALRHQAIVGTALDPPLARLRAWQSARLARTYADLLADRQYRPAGLFFLSDLYAPRDFSQRDHDAERLHAFLARVVPAPMLQLLTDVIALNTLSSALDRQLAAVLAPELALTDGLTGAQYADGYRRCDNVAARTRQIDLLLQVVGQVREGARARGVGLALAAVRGPARHAGWAELFDFLERGYVAFKQIRDLPPFLHAIDERERSLLRRIVSGDPDPFRG